MNFIAEMQILKRKIEQLKFKNKSLKGKVNLWKNRVGEAADIIANYEEFQTENKQLKIKQKELIIKALYLAGTVDTDGDYWGHDTNLGKFDEIVEEILN